MYQSTASLSRVIQETAELSDAHCHLNLFENPEGTLSDCALNGMMIILATGGSATDNVQISALCDKEIVFGIIGISPDFAESEAYAVDDLAKLIKLNHKIVGIGEIGLDSKAAKTQKAMEMQKEIFEKQLIIANELGLPVVIHSRGMLKEVIEMLDLHKVKRAMFHFFEGNATDAKELEKRGYLMSVPPVENRNRKDAIAAIDVKNIVVETDSPVVGKSPLDVRKSLEMISKIKGISAAELAQITTDNLRSFFYI